MLHNISLLPFVYNFDTVAILKALTKAHKALAELKGSEDILPNKSILISALSLQEAKDSSEIENIITTHDELYRSNYSMKRFSSTAAKEVYAYKEALFHGNRLVSKHGLILVSHILEIQSIIEENDAWFRRLPWTVLRNDRTNETVYTPPQHIDEIESLMKNLEIFMNDATICDWDPLIKMAIIHHQFESIHPFYDGNGRTGRIINILYLVKENLLSSPILYLSGYINRHREEYYKLLQSTRNTGDWDSWVIFILEGISKTAESTILHIREIKKIMQSHKQKIREKLPKIYSHELLNNIFHHPYTKIEYVMEDLKVSRITATRYLEELVQIGILSKKKIWRESFYINIELFRLLYENMNS